MKIALLSDIHANLPALEAVLADIEKQKPDTFYCLGDFIGYNVWPNQVIGLIRENRIASIAGNHDLKVAKFLTKQDNCSTSSTRTCCVLYILINLIIEYQIRGRRQTIASI